MDNQAKPAAMSQMIFNMGLPVETVSLYLLCCGLYDAGTAISTQNLSEVWNGTEDALAEGLKELQTRNILRQVLSDRKETAVYRLIADTDWQTGG